MIYAALEDAARYLGSHKNMDTALRFILSGGLEGLAPGRTDIDGSEVYASRAEFEPKAREDAAFEGHRLYADIHIPLEGCEEIAVARLEGQALVSEAPDRDFYVYEAEPETAVELCPGRMLITYPEDLHRPGVRCSGDDIVKKVVLKVRMG